MLYDTIYEDYKVAFKARDMAKKGILSELISRCKYKKTEKDFSGELTDEIVLKLIEKLIKELDEEALSCKQAGEKYLDRYETLNLQTEILKSYMPKQLSEDEIKQIIASLEDKSMPSIMKHFKANYAGKCDMGLVNKIAKQG